MWPPGLARFVAGLSDGAQLSAPSAQHQRGPRPTAHPCVFRIQHWHTRRPVRVRAAAKPTRTHAAHGAVADAAPQLAAASRSAHTAPHRGGGASDAGAVAPDPREMRRLFQELDRDHSGSISGGELAAALRRLGLPASPDYLAEVVAQYDTDHDGLVSAAEFERYVAKREADMREAFAELGGDRDGRIDAAGLSVVLQRAGLPASPADAARMVALLDRDGNRVVTFDEFRRYACLLPSAQVKNHNVAYCWVDSADWINGVEYRLSMVPPKQPAQRLVAGGLAGALSRTLVAPIERLRTMMMAGAGRASMRDNLRTMWADGGLAGLWKGNMATMLKTIPGNAIQFAAYDQAKDLLTRCVPRPPGTELRQWEQLAAGAAAGVASTLAVYPLDTLRTQMAMTRGAAGRLPAVARALWAAAGWRGFYQGLKPALLTDAVSTGLGFASYEAGQRAWRNTHGGASPSPAVRGFIGGLSATLVMTTTMPLEVVMRRLQMSGLPGQPVYPGVRAAFTTILAEEGVSAFWRGTVSSWMKVAPSIAATYLLYDLLVQVWGIGGIRRYAHDSIQTARQQQQKKAQPQPAS